MPVCGEAVGVRRDRDVEENKDDRIPMYQKEILRLLRLLWKQKDFRMWQQIYTIIHCFCKTKGVEKYDGRK